MNFLRKNLKEDLRLCWRKTNKFMASCAKWIGNVSTTGYHLTGDYCKLKVSQYKVKDECFKLGKSAYNQWKHEQDISLIDKLQHIRQMELELQAIQKNVKRGVIKMGMLFGIKRNSATIIVQKKSVSVGEGINKEKSIPQSSGEQQKTSSSSPELKTGDRAVKKTTPVKKTSGSSKKPVAQTAKKKTQPSAPKKSAESGGKTADTNNSTES
ncbi:MAG: hypothetical protein RBU23_05600 [Candidatus Auribacterota bacterium]|jgi:hypothetical protein|nr:hypothetical protein [Candidatus Auribacterota bacterium]